MEINEEQQTDNNDLNVQLAAALEEIDTLKEANLLGEKQLSKAVAQIEALTADTTKDVKDIRDAYESRFQGLTAAITKQAFIKELGGDAEVADFLYEKYKNRLDMDTDDFSITVLSDKGKPEYVRGGPKTVADFAGEVKATHKGFFQAPDTAEGGVRYITQQQALDASFLRREGITLDAMGDGRVVIDRDGSKTGAIATKQAPTSKGALKITRAEMRNTRAWCHQNGVPATEFLSKLNANEIAIVD